MGARWFGARVARKEDPAFLTGGGRYIDDIVLPGMLHAAFVRSQVAHALIESIDLEDARAMPGVAAIMTYDDLPEIAKADTIPLLVPNPALTAPRMPFALASGEVGYVGEPIAIVIATSRAEAEDAAERVIVDYAPLDAVDSLDSALAADGPRAWQGSDTNVSGRLVIKVGETAPAFEDAPHILHERILQHRGGAFFMECRGAIASWSTAEEHLTFQVSSQGPHRHKRTLMDVFGLHDDQVRATSPDVGGGFGPKGSFYAEYAALAAASMQLGVPVKWIEDRRENFVATHQERDQIWDLEIAVEEDGRIRGVRGALFHDMGAYTPWGVVLPWIAATTLPGPYVLPSYELEVVCVTTNKVATTPVRGAGRPQAVVAMERLMDRVAETLNLDRAEVRARNFVTPDQMPYDVGIPFRDGRSVTYDSGDYPRVQADMLERLDYAGFPERQAKARAEGRFLGFGIGNAVEGTGLGPYEGATTRVGTDGGLTVYTGATPQGQSHKTTLAQIAADELGVDPEAVTIVTGDTATISMGIGTFAARTAVNAGSSVHLSAKEVARKIKQTAATMMEADPDDIVLEHGFAVNTSGNKQRLSFKQLAQASIGMPGFALANPEGPGLEHTAYFQPERSTYANSTVGVEVELDPVTGRVDLKRLVIAHDCGKVINPTIVDGQIVGGVAHGIGNALLERMVYDEEAQPVSTNFGEYLLPLATDVPEIEIIHHETASPLNPLGMKGAGEGGTIPTIGAILSAVNDALGPDRARIRSVPIRPQDVIAALNTPADAP